MGDLVISIPRDRLKSYVVRQLNTFFPDGNDVSETDRDLCAAFDAALERLELCFSHISKEIVRGYSIMKNGLELPYFQHTNSDQYSQFLYFLSNSLWKKAPDKSWICDKIILLNKALHACWFTYKVQLPDIFLFVHPVGSVIGHAKYSNYLVITQNVTIGDRQYVKDEIGEYCFLAGGASIIGKGSIGKYCSVGINTTVFEEDIPDHSIVFTDKKTGSKRIVLQKKAKSRAECYFK